MFSHSSSGLFDSPPDKSKQVTVVGCCLLIFVLIVPITIMSIWLPAYTHLGPDEQVVIHNPKGKHVINGVWSGQLNPFYDREKRKVLFINAFQLAYIRSHLTGEHRTEVGPQVIFLDAYDELKTVRNAIVLLQTQWLRLSDKMTGEELIEEGPKTIWPNFTHEYPDGVQNKIYLNEGVSVLVRDRITGQKSVVTQCNNQRTSRNIFVPQPLQDIVEIRPATRVMPHEAVVVRAVDGSFTVYNGKTPDVSLPGVCHTSSLQTNQGLSFFLGAYSKILRMQWSHYPDPKEEVAALNVESVVSTRRLEPIEGEPSSYHIPLPSTPTVSIAPAKPDLEEGLIHEFGADHRRLSIYVDQVASSQHSGPKIKVSSIDLRNQKSFFEYRLNTGDNVRLRVAGTIYWKIKDVPKMLQLTADPVGDLWYKCRSIMTSVVGGVKFADFTSEFNNIISEALQKTQLDDFYSKRGIEVEDLELNDFEPVDEHTRDTFQSIIRENVKRQNALEKQRSDNEVADEKMKADVIYETQRKELVEVLGKNRELEAETRGAVTGQKSRVMNSFMDGLNASIPDESARVKIVRQWMRYSAIEIDTTNLAHANANLYIAPNDVVLKLLTGRAH